MNNTVQIFTAIKGFIAEWQESESSVQTTAAADKLAKRLLELKVIESTTANDFLTHLHADILAGKHPGIAYAENVSEHEIRIFPHTGAPFLFGYPIDEDDDVDWDDDEDAMDEEDDDDRHDA